LSVDNNLSKSVTTDNSKNIRRNVSKTPAFAILDVETNKNIKS